MDTDKNLGKNIRAIRRAYGESLEALGHALDMEKEKSKSAVAYYETGKRHLKPEALSKIAKHYMVTVDELVNSNFSWIHPVKINTNLFFDNINTILPIFSTKEAEMDHSFQKALSAHQQLFDLLRIKGVAVLTEDLIEQAVNEYTTAIEHEQLRDLSMINLFGIFLFVLLIFVTTSHIFDFDENSGEINNAVVSYFMEQDPRVWYQLTGIQQSDIAAIEEAGRSLIDKFDLDELFYDLRCLKESKYKKLHDAAEYYYALFYMWGIIPNNLSFESNRLIGREILTMQANLGNKYSRRFLTLK